LPVRREDQEKRTAAGCLWAICIPLLLAAGLLLAPAFGPRSLQVGRVSLIVSNGGSDLKGLTYQKDRSGEGWVLVIGRWYWVAGIIDHGR